MKKMLKRIMGLAIASTICATVLPMNLQTANAVDLNNSININLSQSDQTETNNTINNIEMDISLESNELIHDSQIPIEISVRWNKENWDADLSGVALIYSTNEQTVLFGMASGYNGQRIDENFINLNFTYDVETGQCIANATYDITTEQNNQVEFGVNSDVFSDAYKFLENKMTEQSDQEEDIQFLSLYAVNTATRFLFSHTSQCIKLVAYAPQNIITSGENPISATVKENASKATDYIEFILIKLLGL